MQHKAEDEAFERWRRAPSDTTLIPLVAALRRYARAIVFQTVSPFDPTLAEEIVSKALMQVESFEGKSAFSTWFYRLAKNACYDVLRDRLKHRRTQSLDSLRGDNFDALADNRALETVDYELLLGNLLPHLDVEEQELLKRRLEGQDYEEIGRWLGMTYRGAQTKWSRLRAKLQRVMTAST